MILSQSKQLNYSTATQDCHQSHDLKKTSRNPLTSSASLFTYLMMHNLLKTFHRHTALSIRSSHIFLNREHPSLRLDFRRAPQHSKLLLSSTKTNMVQIEEEDYKLPSDLFQAKIATLEPLKQAEYLSEYYKRLYLEGQLEIQKLTTMNEQLALMNRVIKSIQALVLGSPSSIFNYVRGLDLVPVESRPCPMEAIEVLWRRFRHSDKMPDLAASSTLVEEKYVQAAFSVAVEAILYSLQDSNRPSLRNKTCMAGSRHLPDLVLVRERTAVLDLQDVVAVVDLKSPSVSLNEITRQAALYLSEQFQIRASRNLPLSSLIALGSNYAEICIFGVPVPDTSMGLHRYTVAPCFPIGWKTLESPTEGFVELCHAMYHIGKNASKYIPINESVGIIVDTFHENTRIGTSVYKCTYRNEDIVVKQGYEVSGKSLVDEELEHLKVVSKVVEFHPYLLPWRQDLRIAHGFAMYLGTVISTPSLLTEEFLEKQFCWLVQGLRILHKNDMNHMDIRPGNIIIYEDTARITDWMTMRRGEIIPECLVSLHDDPFWPVLREKFQERKLFYLWDLTSLGYTFLFLAVKDLSVRWDMQIERLDVVKSLLNDPTLVGKLARIVQYLETTSLDTDQNSVYETCLSMIK